MTNPYICPGCLKPYERTPANFFKRTRSADGLESRCKTCRSAYFRAQYQADREKRHSANRRWRKAHPDRLKVYSRRWYAKCKLKRLARILERET